MIQIKFYLSTELGNRLKVFVSESEASMWVLVADRDIRDGTKPETTYLTGYFETKRVAIENWNDLQSIFPELPELPEFHRLKNQEWQEAYKQHYRPWSCGDMHWVPDWERNSYPVPIGQHATYLDPGMAFGMSDHPSSRLCLLALVRLRNRWATMIENKIVIDAGCGSGVLALSAAKLGFEQVYAFDHDPVAIRVSRKNRDCNGLTKRVIIELAELKAVMVNRTADLILVNMLSSTLRDHAHSLLLAVNPNGYLVLSGMFERELKEVKASFQATMKHLKMKVNIRANTIGD